MALTFPLTLAQFFDRIGVIAQPFYLSAAVISAGETEGGEVMTASIGARLWQGALSIRANTYLTADQIQSKIELLQQTGGAFNVGDKKRAYPQNDPTGAILGAAAPTISAINANSRDIGITGLPASYRITEGDLMTIPYGSSPVRYGLHRAQATVTANGSGLIAAIEVAPPIRPGVIVGSSVVLARPYCKAVIVPGSVTMPETTRSPRWVATLSWRQTLR